MNPTTVIHHPAITPPQLFDMVGGPLDHGGLMKKSSVPVPLPNPLDSGLLPQEGFLLPQKRVMLGKLTSELPHLQLMKAPLLILPLL